MRHLWIVLLLCFASSVCFGQFTSTRHHQPTGFYMTKVVSDTTISIGQPFSYTVYFNIPVGTTSLSLSDQLPSPLIYLNSTYSLPVAQCGTSVPLVTVTTPQANNLNTYTLTLNNIPSCAVGVGSFTITVQFPNGTTCNGIDVFNRVCASGIINGISLPQGFCHDPGVRTVARAVNPWKIKKLPIVPSYNSTTGCWQTADSVIKWGIRVYKDNPDVTGNLNAVNAVVTDVLPQGATLVSSTCGATQSGNIVTWNAGALDATLSSSYYDCELVVSYPRSIYPLGTTVSNIAQLGGVLGSAASPCGNLSDSSDRTCVAFVSNIPTSGYTQKNLYTATQQAGCFAQYELFFCNRGVSTIASFTGQDILPASIASTATISSVQSGITATLTNGIVNVTSVTPLLVGECRSVTINFTIPQVPAGTVISNTMSMTYGAPSTTTQATTSFTVRENKPIPCLYKEVCNKQVDYQLGSTFRYRLRIQNIGGGALSGVTLTDVLNSNLEYIGNPSYHIGTSYATPCGGGATWTGPSITPPNPSTNTVSVTLPPIASQVCDVKASPSCGANGTAGLNYYFIEFDVRVRDSSALGNIPNAFSVSGGNLGYELFSDPVYVLVVGNPVLSVAKSVRSSSAQSYSTSTSAASGGTIRYRLEATVPTGAPFLKDIHIVDLLPKNDGTNSDKFITSPCANRGSQFDVTLANLSIISQTGTSYYTHLITPGTSGQQPSYLTFAGTGAMPLLFNNGSTCGINGNWGNPLTIGAKNLGFYLGTVLPGTGIKTIEFDANVSNTATNGQTACNTFVAGGWAQFLINSSSVSFQRVLSPESNTACVTIANSNKCLQVRRDSVTVVGWVNGTCTNSIYTTLTNPNATPSTFTIIAPNGITVNPSNITIAANTTMQQIFTVSSILPANQNICLRITNSFGSKIPCDSICFTTIACQTVPSCKNLLVSLNNPAATCAGVDGNGNRMYSVTMTGTNSNGPVTIQFPTTQIGNASISPSTFAISSNGAFTASFTYTDLIPVTTSPFVTVTYNIINSLGQSVTCTSIVDLPNCPPPPNTCCQNFVKRVQYTQAQLGIPPSGLVNSGNINLGATLFAGPNPIQKFTATIVSAQTRMVRRIVGFVSPVFIPLTGQQGQWRRTFGDVRPVGGSAGTLFTSPSTLIPMVIPPTNGTTPVVGQFPNRVREATWQSPVCRDWRNGIPMRLLMKFPEPMANHTQPSDRFEQLSFSVKFSFTDCNCITCDTVIHFLVARRRVPGPFGGNDGYTSIRRGKPGEQVQGIQEAIPAQTSIVMESESKGKLWIVNPNTPENTITVKGVEIVSEIAEITSLRNGTTAGFMDKTIGVISTNVKPGENGEIDMVMKPISGLSVYKYDVRFQYTDSTSDEIQYSDVYSMTARVPGSSPDIMEIDKSTKPANVKSYSVFFRNVNGYKENVSRIRVKTSGNVRILAVGPQSENGTEVTLIPVYKQSGSIVLPPMEDAASVVEPDSTLKPIYLTLSGVNSDAIRLNYEALDDNNTVISTGSFLLSDPITGVKHDHEDKALGMEILSVPNPASNITTISINLANPLQRASVKLVDLLGREVLTVISNSPLALGNHVFATDVSELPVGSYFIILDSEIGQVSESLIISK